MLSPISFILGIETGFSSAGAGALGTVMIFNFTELSPALVVGTNLLFGLIISATAGGIHAASCDFHALAQLVPGGLVGVYMGSRVSLGSSVHALRKALLYCTILLGAFLLGKGIAAI